MDDYERNVVKRFYKDEPYSVSVWRRKNIYTGEESFFVDGGCYEEVDEEIDEMDFETLEEVCDLFRGMGFSEVKPC